MTASSEGDGRTVDSVHHPSTATSTPAAAAAAAAAAAVNTFRPTIDLKHQQLSQMDPRGGLVL